MKLKPVLCSVMLAACSAHAEESPLTLGAGFHYSAGDYGTGSETRIAALAFSARYDNGPWTYRAAVPWLKVEGDAEVIPGVGAVGSASTERRTESGLGDVVLSATYAAYYDRTSTVGLDLTGKLKLPTASEEKGLGTGELDFAVLGELYKTYDQVTAFGGVGYHILGDAPERALDNVWSAYLGASYRIDERDSAGVTLEGRERVAAGADRQRELTAFFMRRLDKLTRLQVYALIGLADGSPDWGAGLSFSRPF